METAPHRAAIPNPALKAFEALVGTWKTTGTHSQVPDTLLQGRASFNWLEGGAFLILRAEIDHELFPASITIFGTDQTNGECFMLYFDEQQVSRKMEVTFENHVLKWWRKGPEFSQRYVFEFPDHDHIITKGELSKDGVNWEPDLDLEYTRLT